MMTGDGSVAEMRVFPLFVCAWELLYRLARFATRRCLARRPGWILEPSLLEGDGETSRRRRDAAERVIIERGPSYAVSLLHSICVTWRGATHLWDLWSASNLDKLVLNPEEAIRWAQLRVARTNEMFAAYLVYDLLHVSAQYPKLGGLEVIVHHMLFAACSFINGTYALMPFPFGWLIVGEMSTVFLNARWFLLKSGREGSSLVDSVNGLFAATFFLTRVGIYSAGIVHLFIWSLPELRSLPERTGVPVMLLGVTCGSMILGWALNLLWAKKIWAMLHRSRGGDDTGEKRKRQ
ncbi:hypothetical protein ACHAWF_017468 [Thalassiosira exigua]